MHKPFGLLFSTVLVMMILMTSCPSPTSSSSSVTVKDVVITGTKTTIKVGESGDFSVEVNLSNGKKETSATWVLGGYSSSGTTLVNPNPTDTGTRRLTVAANETATELVITATSTRDKKKSRSLTVKVTANDPGTPAVLNVSINPETTTAERGGTPVDFTVAVEATGGANEAVTWVLGGTSNPGTTLAAHPSDAKKRRLTVAANETAATLTITATSVFNPDKKGTATVTLVNAGDGVKSITVSPTSASVSRGETQEFTVAIEVKNVSDEVRWEISPDNNNLTKIEWSVHSATLTVAANEIASTLYVKVFSVVDETKYAQATVTVTGTAPATEIWLVGSMNAWTLPGTPMNNPSDNTWTWNGTVYAGSTFRFSLNDTSEWDLNPWNGNWLAPAAAEAEVTLGNNLNTMSYFPTNTSDGATEATNNVWKVTETGKYTFTVNREADNYTLKVVYEALPITDIWLVGGTSIDKSIPGTKMDRNGNTYTRIITVPNGGNYEFMFNLLDTSEWPDGNTKWNGMWFAHATDSTDATIGSAGNGVKRFNGNTVNWWKLPTAGDYTITLTLAEPNNTRFTVVEHIGEIPVTDMWLVGSMSNWDMPPPPMSKMEKQESGSAFVWEGTALAGSTFRFSPDNTSAWEGRWFFPADENEKVITQGTDTYFIASDTGDPGEGNKQWKVTKTGKYTFTVRPAAKTLTVIYEELPIDKVWIVGSVKKIGNDYDPSGIEMVKNGTTYTIQIEVPQEGCMFNFSLLDTSNWPEMRWNGSWFAPETNNTTVTEGASIPMTRINGGTVHYWKISGAGNYTITLNSAAKTFTVAKAAPPPPNDMWLVGDMNNWALPGISMSKSDGNFTWTGTALAGSTFRFSLDAKTTGNWNGGWLIPADGDVKVVTLGNTTNATERFTGDPGTGNKQWKVTETGTYTFTVDTTAQTLKVVYQELELPKDNKVWLVGDINNWDLPGMLMTKGTGNTYTIKITVPDSSLFKISLFDTSGLADTRKHEGVWIAADEKVEDGKPTTLNNTIERINTSTENNWKLTTAGNYTITLNLDQPNLHVEKEIVELPFEVEDIWVKGITGNWEGSGIKMSEPSEGVFTWESTTEIPADRYFRFNLNDTGTNWFIPEYNGVEVNVGEYTLTPKEGTTNFAWKIEETGWYKFTVNIQTQKLTVERPITIDSVTIASNYAQLYKGRDYDFTATLTGKNTSLAVISWEITSTGHQADTKFAANKLTVSATENKAITIMASTGGKNSATKTFNVTDPPETGKVDITLSYTDKGASFTVGGIPQGGITLYKTGGTASETKVTLTASNSNTNDTNAYTYTWYVDDAPKGTGPSIELNAANYGVGSHRVLLVIKSGSQNWSISDIVRFSVSAKK